MAAGVRNPSQVPTSPSTIIATPTRARGPPPLAAPATAVADFFLRLANPGAGWSRGWTSGCRGERPRPMGSRRDRRAVAHSGWGPVDHNRYTYARARPAAAAATAVADSFCVWRIPEPAGAGDGPRAAGASGRDLWGRGAIAGLLRTAAGAPLTIIATPTRARGPPPLAAAARRPRSPISFCVWRIPEPAGAGDGPRAAGASGRDLWGLGAIAGLLRTAAGGLRRALYPLTWCSGSGTRR